MQRTNKKVLTLTAIAAAIMLSACGGGGSGSSGSIGAPATPGAGTGTTPVANTLTVLSGDSIVVPGSMTTSVTLLKSMKWSVSPQSSNAPALVLSNDSCGVAIKNDQIFTPVPGSVGTSKTGESTWKCDLGIVAPKGVTAEATYKLLLSGTDDKGNTVTNETVLKVQPNPKNATSPTNPTGTTVSAGKDFAVTSGQTAPLSCDAPTGSTYQWVVTDNGGLAFALSSDNSQTSGFTAPVVTTPTKVTLTCRATNATNEVQTASVNVTINPVATQTTTLNAQIPNSVTGVPGTGIQIASTTAWYDASGKATDGPVINYNWALGTVPTGVSLLSNGTSSTQLYVTPGSITTPTYVPVNLTATSNGQTSTASVSVLVDPNGALNPTVDKSAQVVKVGEAASVTVTATGSANLYYQWTQVSGVPVILGGATTKTVGFVAPTVTSPSTVVLRVAIGYTPITTTNPGTYFVDAVAQVQP
jgi:hypothetical protein